MTINALNVVFMIATICLTVAAIANYGVALRKSRAAQLAAKSRKRGKKVVQTVAQPKKNGIELSERAYIIILCAIVLIGVVLRLVKFGSVPGGFNQDGAMAAVDGKALAEYGTDRFGTWLPAHLYAWGYSQMSSLLSYIDAIFIKFFGLNEITARLPLLLASLMGGTFFYLFVRDTFGKNVALIAAGFVAVNPWHFMQSRWALEANLLPHFFMAGVYFLSRGLGGKRKFTYISMIFFGLSMYCYGVSIYTVPAFLAAAAIYYFVKKKLPLKDLLISLGIYLFIAWPFILTMAVNYFKWDTIKLPFVTIQYFSDSVRSNDILLFSDHPLEQLKTNISALLDTTLLQKKDLPWSDITGFGTMFKCTMPFVFAGFFRFYLVKTDAPKGLAVLALLTGVWTGLLTNGVNVNRINIIYYGIMIFAVLGIYFVITEIPWSKWVNTGIYGILAIMFVTAYFTTYADEIKTYFYYGFKDALIAAEDSGAEKIYVTADAQGKGYTSTSEILTMFYDKTDAKYFQGETNVNNGKELLPYSERFTYESMSQQLADSTKDEDAAYVIMATDASYFDSTKYDITEYGGRFCSVVKKQEAR